MPKRRSNGRVSNTTSARKEISNPTQPSRESDSLIFDFSYTNWLKSISIRNFTNMLKDDIEFAQHVINLFTKVIPTVTKNWAIIRYNGGFYNRQFEHCHTISDEKLEQVKAIVNEIHGNSLLDEEDEDLKFWQLGVTQSLRLIGIYSSNTNTMYPIFLDYHHQIYPSIKHNQRDIESYSHCPVTAYS